MKLFLKRKTHIGVALGLFFANYVLDRVTKYIASVYLKDSEPVRLLKDTILLLYAENTGAFLSLGTHWNIYIKYFVLLIIPLIICIIGLLYVMLKEIKLYRIAIISCIIGGGIGNLVDRLCNEFKVIDFINFGIGRLRTGILNAADLSVTFGAILLMIYETIIKKEKDQNKM
ncbi:MAG: signal peptidase II [Treponema sp.]|jgi:signal peptidase II|nr:signal peptidase II [Treponema sp.]